MSLSDSVFDVLLILLYLMTPLVFAASLFFQDRNRSPRTFFSPTEPTHPVPPSHSEEESQKLQKTINR